MPAESSIPRCRDGAGATSQRSPREAVLSLMTSLSAAAAHDRSRESLLDLPHRLCEAVTRVLPVDGAGLAVMFNPIMSVPVGASDATVVAAEQIQFTMAEGPCWQAAANSRPFVIEDLADPHAPGTPSAPTYAAEVVRTTAYRSAASFPGLLSGSLPVFLTLYRRSPRHWDVPLLEEVARQVFTTLQDSAVLDPGSGEVQHVWLDAPATSARSAVWVAEGMIMERSGLDADGALWVLRALAHSRGLTADELADELVNHRVRVDDLLD